MSKKNLDWKCHVPRLFKEIMVNQQCAALHIPLTIFQGILVEVAERATALNDTELNKLMMRLALYSVSDPDDKEYNADLTTKYIAGEIK
jgi:hypothetical protein